MKIDDIKNIAVIGAGDMGHGIAEVALIAGYTVFFQDIDEQRVVAGVKRIYNSLKKLVDKGKVPQEHADKIKSQLLKPCNNLKDAAQGADLVIEAVPEIMNLKKKIFRDMDAAAPSHAILASNTSSMKITDIASATSRPEKVLGLHYFNPVVFMKLVEVIRGEKTAEETMQIGCEFVQKNKKLPVRVEKDIPGFIVNRVEAPYYVLLECILDEKIAEPEAVDALLLQRGIPMGPFEVMDFTGLDVAVGFSSYFAETVHPDYKTGHTIASLVERGDLGKKTGKGLYDWSNGRRKIDISKATDRVDPLDLDSVMINEATKIIELGACSAEDLDKAVVNGTGRSKGPMALAAKMSPEKLASRLESLAKRFNKEIFKPTEMIREGKYLE